MSIRMWLRTADCLRCGTSIALEYFERRSVSASPAARSARSPVPADPEQEYLAELADLSIVPPPVVSRTRRVLRSLHQLLACLLSMVAHLLLLILLALFTFGSRFELPDEAINLSVEFKDHHREGDVVVQDEFVQPVGFDLPADARDAAERIEAEEWAEQLMVADAASAPNLPPLERVADALQSDDRYRRMLSARDPRIRDRVLEQEGGTNLTEAAVARALRWMADHQHSAGNWSLDRFDRCEACDGECRDTGHLRSDEGATALVLQAMLGAGQTHRTGIYRDEVSHGLQYLLSIQRQNGDLTGDSHRQAGMYVHALATIALCDALALTGDERLRQPAQLGVDFLVRAQHSGGGWRYQPGDRGDLSVTGWQLMALHSARAAGLEVKPSSLNRSRYFLDSVATDSMGSQYGYMPGHPPSPAMTAEGLLSRMYLGWKRTEPGLRQGVRELARRHPPSLRDRDIYYWYYATQVLHHWGGAEWRDWNKELSEILVTTQIRSGHASGSWDPNTPHGRPGGRLYMTALATCTLEVYYRHAPLFRRIKLEN